MERIIKIKPDNNYSYWPYNYPVIKVFGYFC